MEPATLALVALWVPLSLLGHTTLHEGSHALAGISTGMKVQRFSVLPEFYGGRLRFGYTKMYSDHPVSARARFFYCVAPMVSELLWFTVVATVRAVFDLPLWLNLILGIEMVASLVDMTTWFLGAWTRHPASDPMLMGQVSPATLRVTSVAMMVPLYGLTVSFLF